MSSSPRSSPTSERGRIHYGGVLPPGVALWRNGARARARLVVELDGKKVLAPRVIRLLGEIGREGSVRRAAFTLGIGYRHAIAWIRDLESLLECPLVIRRAGGAAGGGAGLTLDGIMLVRRYQDLERALARVAARAEGALRCSRGRP